LSADELAESDPKSIHRDICEHFRSRLKDNNIVYHLAPFSIRKGGNIHGVIFGSGKLLGLEKFLTAAWKLDMKTGEANFPIDNDPTIRDGERFLFPELEVSTKQDDFKQELKEMLHGETNPSGSASRVNNLTLYRFALERGFLPKHVNAHLRALQKEGRLEVLDPASGKGVRKGAFYVDWQHYRDSVIGAEFRLKD
jgi:hypothetical protein